MNFKAIAASLIVIFSFVPMSVNAGWPDLRGNYGIELSGEFPASEERLYLCGNLGIFTQTEVNGETTQRPTDLVCPWS